MVSIKSVLALVLLAAVCANATYVKPTVIRKCSQGYYSKWNLSYSGEWKKSTNLIQSIFGLVGGLVQLVEGLLNTILGIVGNLLGGLLGISKTNSILDKVFATPYNQGSAIQLMIRIMILNAPIYEKINPGFSKICMKAVMANIIIAVSVRGGNWSGLGFNPLTGDKSTWVSKCGCNNIKKEWDDHLLSIGGKISLSAAKRIHYDLVEGLIANLIAGVGILVDGLLEKVMTDVVCMYALMCNLYDNSLESALTELLNILSDIFVSVDINVLRIKIRVLVSQYNSSQFCNCFRCY